MASPRRFLATSMTCARLRSPHAHPRPPWTLRARALSCIPVSHIYMEQPLCRAPVITPPPDALRAYELHTHLCSGPSCIAASLDLACMAHQGIGVGLAAAAAAAAGPQPSSCSDLVQALRQLPADVVYANVWSRLRREDKGSFKLTAQGAFAFDHAARAPQRAAAARRRGAAGCSAVAVRGSQLHLVLFSPRASGVELRPSRGLGQNPQRAAQERPRRPPAAHELCHQ